jgi:HAD superfamily hydrolase (TIGR01509 family)
VSRLVVFLDDGGVMNDNARRGPQWQRLVAEFFAPLLGGEPAAWAEANRVVAEGLLEPAAWQARLREASNYASFDRAYQRDWLGGMCALVGVAAPPEEEGFALACRANDWITRRVRSACPGAVEAIRALAARGYALHTASGELSADLAGYLEGMGVRECFGRLYGPDLLDTFKEGPEYYARLFADADVAPADALVVDDSPRAVAWAASVGARAVLVGATSPPPGDGATPRIAGLFELPALLERLA